ncbi:histidine phosphatase family protein [Staphylococcus kloosii]|uniref:Histidine phosphatase family protein n=1 Tax=Staphylococcus kloosii TaxID=29384 RepID=A0ABQ0XJD6_9STAP|nr:histidine phosphatase family protein [Staphylococcus kloosii]AVQ35135.1 histidine phosphatase family protein [Staphylococcus kloosii]PNZ08232.1 hypothetical protein CD136_01100 [Staphylococcus kloosii]GEP81573.1 histidine phosphatase family protein [Staphylococcus kloosii]SUM48177.1 alpha-ribazole phosphatase [Staphylococcus kloosii]
MLYFIRHGQAEHNLNEPHNFDLKNPKLTKHGINQIKKLRMLFNNNTKIWCSPTVRTIESAQLISGTAQLNILDILGPRTFPHKICSMHNCDQLNFDLSNINISIIKLLNNVHPNDFTDEAFMNIFKNFIKNYVDEQYDHLFVTHDGVIATLLKYCNDVSLDRDSNNDLILYNEVHQFEMQNFFS